MKSLSPDWFAKIPVDEEHKRYLLLDYLKDIHHHFNNRELYPPMSDIIYHIKNLEMWNNNRQIFKGGLKGLDFEKMTLLYDTPETSPEMSEINRIVNYSISEMNSVFSYGRKIWRNIEQSLIWNVVGIIPQYKLEGYILIKMGKEVNTYQYKILKVYKDPENLVGTNLTFIEKEEIGLKPYEYIKEKLIKERELPNPLILSVECPEYPLDESIVPIVKTISLSKIYKLDNP